MYGLPSICFEQETFILIFFYLNFFIYLNFEERFFCILAFELQDYFYNILELES